MVGSIPVGHQTILRGRCERCINTQRDHVSVRVGITFGIAFIRDLRIRRGIVIVGVVRVIVCRMVVVVVVADLVCMLHLKSQIRAGHVSERDGEDQQTLENDSHDAHDPVRLRRHFFGGTGRKSTGQQLRIKANLRTGLMNSAFFAQAIGASATH